MKILRHAIVLSMLFFLQFISANSYAESKHVALKAKKLPGFISSTISNIGDIPGHEFAHKIFSLHITGSDSDFDDFKTINYVQFDEINGSGTFNGYAIWPLKNGDVVYIKFSSSTKKIMKENGEWETPFRGVFEFTSGTGKYKNIKGACEYTGLINKEGSSWTAEVDIEY